MAIKVGKLWREPTFLDLSSEAKLLYIYLITAQGLDALGLINIRPQDIRHDLDMEDEVFKDACGELNDGLVKFLGIGKNIWVMVKGHFATLPKSDVTYKRFQKDLDALPGEVIGVVQDLGLMPDIDDIDNFEAPTPEEVEDYGLSLGYIINGKEFIEFYEGHAKRLGRKGWFDGRGKQVKDWKGKLRNVWTRRAEKLNPVDGAPEGYEFFYAKDGDRVVQATRWKDGRPYGSNIVEDKILQGKFNKIGE